MAKKRYKHVTIHPSQGGQLVGSASDDVPLSQATNFLTSSANYTQKLNFRRETDGELRREGWDLFNPTGNDDALSAESPIRGIHQFTGSDGTPVLIAIAGSIIYRLMAGDRRYAIDPTDTLNPSPDKEYATIDGLDASEDLDNVDYFDNDADDFVWQSIMPAETVINYHMDSKDPDGTYKDPFEGGAYRWEFVEIQNHLIINNGVDLPVVYKSEWPAVKPLYGLRENGVVSVGTIASFQDRLVCADLTLITEGYDKWFKYARNPYGKVFPDDEEGEDLDGDGIPEAWEELGYNPNMLPLSVKKSRYQYRIVYSAEGEPKLFNTGVIDPSTNRMIPEGGGLPGNLVINTTATGTTYRFVPDYSYPITENGSLYQTFFNGDYGDFDHVGVYFIPSTDPTFTSVSAIKFDNENFASTERSAAINSLIVKYGIKDEGDSVNYGFTESEIINEMITVIGNLSSGIFLQGNAPAQMGAFTQPYADYLLVNKDQNNVVLLNPNTGSPLSDGFYRVVIRPYVEQIKKPAAFYELVQDGSRILKMKELADKLVVYRDTGFYFVTTTNSPYNPFAVDPRYTGGRVPDFRHTIINLGGNQHLFMGNSGVYVINRSSVEPKVVEKFELGPPFWQIVPPELAEFVYSVDNPITREIFINCPLGYKEDSAGNYIDELGELTDRPVIQWGVIAYDYINETLSQIDSSFTSCASIRKPKYNRIGPDELWFIMAVHQGWDSSSLYIGSDYRDDARYGGTICRYGYGPPERGQTVPYRIYNRLGFGYRSSIKSGLIDFGNSFSDKEVRSYVLELSSKYGTTPVKVKISTNTAPQGTERIETMGDGKDYVILNDIVDENMIPLLIQAPYLRDQIIVEPEYNHQGYAEYGYIKSKVNSEKTNDYYWDDNLPTVIDNPVKMVGRTFEVSGIDTRSTTQTINQG